MLRRTLFLHFAEDNMNNIILLEIFEQRVLYILLVELHLKHMCITGLVQY